MRQDPLGGVRAEGSFNIEGGGLVSAPPLGWSLSWPLAQCEAHQEP